MIISKRAQNLFQHPQFGEIISNERPSYYRWIFKNDKKLTVLYKSSADALRIPLMDTLAYFFNREEGTHLFSLSVKEVESFLRDQNNMPAFSTPIDDIGADLLSSLVREFFYFHHKNASCFLSLVDQNRFWIQVFSRLKNVEFVQKTPEYLYFHLIETDSIVSFKLSE